MAHGYDTMMNPAIEDLLECTDSKFVLVILAAMRSREITNYLGQLGGGIGALVPPQVISTSSKPLSISLEEIAEGKIEAMEVSEEDLAAEAAAAEDAAAIFTEEQGARLVANTPNGRGSAS